MEGLEPETIDTSEPEKGPGYSLIASIIPLTVIRVGSKSLIPAERVLDEQRDVDYKVCR